MKYFFQFFLILGFILFSADISFAQTSIFVSPIGKDTNPGTKDKPYATIEKAQIEARQTKGAVNIILRGGIYYLTHPVVFTSLDSRPDDAPLVLKSFPEERVIISGAVPLKLNWIEYKNGILQAKVEKDLIFDQLFVNGELQRMARYPNYKPEARFLEGTAEDVLSIERIKKYKSPEGAYVHALHAAEWGSLHYIVKGRDEKGELILEGGWQNNRRMGMNKKYCFIENVLEELDTVGEWYFDKIKRVLYFYPPRGLDIKRALFETPQIRSLFEFLGDEKNIVRNISIEGLELTQTIRTFMENKEPLSRSDWTTFRGGTIFIQGAENCEIKECYINAVGGNAIYFNNYNRNNKITGCHIANAGASAICFVGDPNAVRSPSFEYNKCVPFEKMDLIPGPKSNNYPAKCLVYDNLIHNIGYIEKQSAGIQISMSQDITVSHNTIYNVPRAGININDGTWGGNIIEYNDVFNTVLETGDHGAFNSWGRDRYWHSDRKVMDSLLTVHPELILLDAIKTNIIRNNRFKCDHGWDIDLDDGSSNYEIYNNLCLNGGLKLREGFFRIVYNNVLINNSFHPHVWFKDSKDVFMHNIVSTAYAPIRVTSWGKFINHNAFCDSVSLSRAQRNNTDQNSVVGDPMFIDPANGNYQVAEESPALKCGFINFEMDKFGVVSPKLKDISKKVGLPAVVTFENQNGNKH